VLVDSSQIFEEGKMEQGMSILAENWLWLVIALFLGVLLGWLFTGLPSSRSRNKAAQQAAELEKQLLATQRKVEDAEQRLQLMEHKLTDETNRSARELQQNSGLQVKIDQLQSTLEQKENELADAQAKLAGPVRLFKQVSGVSPESVSIEHLTAAKSPAIVNAILAGLRPKLVSSPQDMVIVPSIGKASEQRLYNAGIGTYWELANLSADDLIQILQLTPAQKANLNYEEVRTTSLRLAQESESMGAIWNARQTDDFESIPGISGVFEQRLYSAGISTFEELAACSIEQLRDVCHAPLTMMPNYGAWIVKAQELVNKRNGSVNPAVTAN
jgi:predicted flap endonuclease-1-like 5' DNA nuclease